MTCHRFCTQNNMTSVTSGAGNANPSGTPELISDALVGFVLLNLYFSVWSAFSTIDCPVVDFLFAIVLCVLFFLFFCIFKLFGQKKSSANVIRKVNCTWLTILFCVVIFVDLYIYIYIMVLRCFWASYILWI